MTGLRSPTREADFAVRVQHVLLCTRRALHAARSAAIPARWRKNDLTASRSGDTLLTFYRLGFIGLEAPIHQPPLRHLSRVCCSTRSAPVERHQRPSLGGKIQTQGAGMGSWLGALKLGLPCWHPASPRTSLKEKTGAPTPLSICENELSFPS